MQRIYQSGRSTAGIVKDGLIRSLLEIRNGDVLIAVSHQFKAENPIVVSMVFDDRFYYDYKDRSKRRGQMCAWGFQIGSAYTDFYKTKPDTV